MEWFKWYVVGVLALVAVVAIGTYASHKFDLLHLQEPIVQTCVQHRVSQKVMMTGD